MPSHKQFHVVDPHVTPKFDAPMQTVPHETLKGYVFDGRGVATLVMDVPVWILDRFCRPVDTSVGLYWFHICRTSPPTCIAENVLGQLQI